MKHSVPHDLGAQRAKQVAEAAFNAYKQRYAEYDPKATWTSDRHADIAFAVKGIHLSGTMDINDSSIDMDLDVPFLLRPFKGKALQVIEDEIRVWIEKAKAGQI